MHKTGCLVAILGLWLCANTAFAEKPPADSYNDIQSRYDAYLEKERTSACGSVHKESFTKESVAAADADEHWSFSRQAEYFLKRRHSNKDISDFLDKFKAYVEDPEHKFNQEDLDKFHELESQLKQKLALTHGVCLAELYGIGSGSALSDEKYNELSDQGYEARTRDTDRVLDDKSITAAEITAADSFPIADSVYKMRAGKGKAEN